MCGIIGIVGRGDVAPQLVDALRRLEYRGYDSAGVATLVGGEIERRRAEGKLANLDRRLAAAPLAGSTGIGHTRWATHGGVTETNAHPHATGGVAIVHNGIIENYAELKEELEAAGRRVESETDTEIVAHLIDHEIGGGADPETAVARVLGRLTGAFALALMFRGREDLLIGARRGTPLAVGWGDGEMYLGSDAMALAPFTNRVSYLEDGDRVVITRDGARVHDADGRPVERPVVVSSHSAAMIGKDGYRHFMLKEIYEQPQAIGDTLNAFVAPGAGRVSLPDLSFDIAAAPRLTIVACGTAYLAGAVAKYWFERLARIPVELDVASEFRYREGPLPAGGAALFISQSGETLDTLEALRFAKREGQRILSVVNVPESTIARESHGVLQTLAGPEIGVASTKAFTTQLAVLACLAVAAARARGHVDAAEETRLCAALREVPARVAEVLSHDDRIQEIARDIALARDVLYIGRGTAFPIALEGALKLKEISYIHAEGYAAGEMKHGPIALIDETVPVVAVAPPDSLFEKTASNIQETAARGGRVLALSDAEGCRKLRAKAAWTVELPACDPVVAPLVYAVPVQLLAYHVAVIKGTDVDQPRNLAKSVTVE